MRVGVGALGGAAVRFALWLGPSGGPARVRRSCSRAVAVLCFRRARCDRLRGGARAGARNQSAAGRRVPAPGPPGPERLPSAPGVPLAVRRTSRRVNECRRPAPARRGRRIQPRALSPVLACKVSAAAAVKRCVCRSRPRFFAVPALAFAACGPACSVGSAAGNLFAVPFSLRGCQGALPVLCVLFCRGCCRRFLSVAAGQDHARLPSLTAPDTGQVRRSFRPSVRCARFQKRQIKSTAPTGAVPYIKRG